MITKFTLNFRSSVLFLLFTVLCLLPPTKSEACIDPDTVITVTTNYNEDFSEIAIVLGNLKFMTEAPNVFCSCSLGSFSDFFTNLEYVAFVQTGTNIPYPNMEPWENNGDVDMAWNDTYPSGYGDWTGFIAEVINGGLGPEDDVELVIRASTPPGYFVNVSEMDSTISLSYLGTDAWSTDDLALLGDHPGLRNLGTDNSSYELILQNDDFFDQLDQGIVLSTDFTHHNIENLSISPNPNSGSFELTYSLNEASNVAFRVYDITGRLLYQKEGLPQSEGIIREAVDLPKEKLGKGLYLFEIVTEGDSVVKKLFITE